MQCRAVNRLPEGPDWEYELKFDGYRALAFKTNRRVWLISRNGRDFAPLFPALVRVLEKLPKNTVIDGEIVALNAAGRPSFNLLQNYQTAAQTIVFLCFRPAGAERTKSYRYAASGASSAAADPSD